nr:RNA-directed DNA polymerase, eukaryota [Tanacetum cinerariifolium]
GWGGGGGAESHQLTLLTNLLDTVILSNMEDRWFFDLNGDGRFCVKDVRCLLDDVFLPKAEVPTRLIKSILIKINIFAWKLCLDRLPTQVNLAKRNMVVASLLCPLCDSGMEDAAHLFFRCDMVKDVMFLVSRWWDLEDRRPLHPWYVDFTGVFFLSILYDQGLREDACGFPSVSPKRQCIRQSDSMLRSDPQLYLVSHPAKAETRARHDIPPAFLGNLHRTPKRILQSMKSRTQETPAQEVSPHPSLPSTYHLGETSSTDPYVTTRVSDRYSWENIINQPRYLTVPRPDINRYPKMATGVPVSHESELLFEMSNIVGRLTHQITRAIYTAKEAIVIGRRAWILLRVLCRLPRKVSGMSGLANSVCDGKMRSVTGK